MIHLTRLNNQPLVVNSDLIKFVERAPDTVITLVTGEKIVVLEGSQQVLDRILEFRRSILAGLPLPAEVTYGGNRAAGGCSAAQASSTQEPSEEKATLGC
jgi:flagellar protein FlbD